MIHDPNWRLRNLYYIVDKQSNWMLFSPNEVQDILNREEAQRKMILKSRQVGVSTQEIIKHFDATIFAENVTTVILAHENDSIKKLFRIVQRAYKKLPEELKPRIDRGGGSKYELFFPDINSRIYCDLESRSDTINRLHISETAFMKDKTRLSSTLQAVPVETGIVTSESTPNGMANHFADEWFDPESVYKKYFFPWFLLNANRIRGVKIDEYTDEELAVIKMAWQKYKVKLNDEHIAFRRFKKRELKEDASEKQVPFEQEYPEDDVSCFISSGGQVFDASGLANIRAMIADAKPPHSDRDYLKIYKPMVKGRIYVIGADVAEGAGRDFSVGVCMDAEKREVVATIRSNKWKPEIFAHKLVELAKLYTSPSQMPPMIAVERNNHGHTTLYELNEQKSYPRIFKHTDEKLGWHTNMITRPIMMDHFVYAIENKLFTTSNKIILAECLTLVNNAGKIEAASGKNDDTIMASAIALQLCSKFGSLSLYDNLEKSILL